MYQRGSGRH